jgi:NTE family protein
MLGALQGIAVTTAWNPGSAGLLLGTSAGSVIASLLAAGLTAEEMVADAIGELPEGGRRPSFGSELTVHWSFPRPVLGSPGLAWRSLREPWRYGPAGIVAWLPQGVISTEPIRQVVKRVLPHGWPEDPVLWVVAVDYQTGERVVFGRRGSPRAALDAAVAASCAVPGFYHPVTIRGRRYIDGGLYSPSNLDELLESEAETVVCLSPMTSPHRGGLLEPTGRIASVVRGSGRSRLLRDARRLEQAGKRVLLLEPGAEALRVMGYNYMSGSRRDQVVATALRTTIAALRGSELGRSLSSLAGDGFGAASEPAG